MSDTELPENTPETVTEAPADPAAAMEAKLKEAEAKYLYLYAEFENFKKRAIKERSDLVKFGWESVARDLLQVIDNLERALEYTPPTTDPNLVTGLNMVLSQFRATLEKQGVKVIEAVKRPFDAEFHEAVGQEPSTTPGEPEGTVVREVQRGYTLHGRLLRPSRVLVSTASSAH